MEWTTAADFGVNETKQVTIVNTIEDDTEGRFRLRFGGQATYALPHDVSAAEIRDALESLVTVAGVEVTVADETLLATATSSGADLVGSSWIVTFLGATGPLPKAGYGCTACVSSVSNDTTITSPSSPFQINVTADLTSVLAVGDRVLLSTHHVNASAYEAACYMLITEIDVDTILATERPGSACALLEDSSALLALEFEDPSGLALEIVDLRSVSGEGTISAYVTELVRGTYPDVYGYTELSAQDTCGISTLGPSSSVQRLVLSAGSNNSTVIPVTAGSYRLALGEHLTACVPYNATPTELASALEELPNVAGGASVFGRIFSDDGTYYPVDNEERIITDGLGYEYLIRFMGTYNSRGNNWPQLRVPPEYFGRTAGGIFECEAFVSTENGTEPSAEVIMLHEEKACSNGNSATQVILAEASSELGGSFSLETHNGQQVVVSLSSTAAEMGILLSFALAMPVSVREARLGDYSRAWLVHFDRAVGEVARLALCDRFATGTAFSVGVYEAVVITTSSTSSDGIAGQFRIVLNGEVSDLISFDASDGRLDMVLQKMKGVGKVVALSPVYPGGKGGVEVERITVFNNSALAEAAGDWTKTLAPGDAVDLDSVDGQYFEVLSLSYDDEADATTIKLDHTVTELPSLNLSSSALVGTAAVSRAQLPGRARMVSSVSVLYSYPNVEAAVRVLELSGGGSVALDIALNSTIVVAGESYNITDFNGDQVLLSRDFVGPTVVAGDVELKVFSTTMDVSFTRDISSIVSTGDVIWIENALGDVDELQIEQSFEKNSTYALSGIFSSDYNGNAAHTVANGRTWILAFKQTTADLNTFQIEPQSDWRGLGATVEVRRPGGISPLTATLGSPSEIQTLALRSSRSWWSIVNENNNNTWSLVLWPEDGSTTSLAWGASADDVEEALNTLSAVSSVEVERMGDGESPEWFYGYVYSFHFWGVHASAGLPQLTVQSSLAGVTAYVNTVRQGAAVASQSPTLVALKEGTRYSIRASAWGTAGYGPSSSIAVAETPSIGVIPGPPTAVTLGTCRYSSTSLGVQWRPPLREGGQRVDAYRIEWDRSPSITESSVAYGTDYLQVVHEVQEIYVNFRSGDSVSTRDGTFTISWGGHSTADLPWNSSASALEVAILGVSGVQEVAVSPVAVTRAPYRNGYRWTVTFMAWRGNLSLLRGDGTLLIGDDPSLTFTEKIAGGADVYPGDYTNEVQAITVSSLSRVSGTFTLAFEGKEIEAVTHNEGAESLKSKLDAIESILCVDVQRFVMSTDLNLFGWYVTFAWLNGEVVPGAGNLGLFTVESTSNLDGNGATVGVSEIVVGTNPLEYTISNLLPGVAYYAHVAAHNSRGFGPFSPTTTSTTKGQPEPPSDVEVSVASGSAIASSWSSPVNNGGAKLTGYMVEWYSTVARGSREIQMVTTSAKEGESEVQTVSIKASANNLGGYYKLSFDGQTTGNIAWDAPATGTDSVRENLERLPGVGEAEVSQDYSSSAVSGLRVDLFVGADNATASNTSSLLPSQSDLVENDIIFLAGYRARVRGFSADGETLFFGSMEDYTEPATFDDDFSVEGVIVEKWAYGYEYTITFTSYNGDAPLVESSASDGWAGTNPVIDIKEITAGLQPISGSFRLRLGGENTPPLSHDATAEDIESALEIFVDVGDVTVSKVLNGYGHNWIVTFHSEMGDVDLMVADGTGLTGPSATVSVSVGQDGVLPSSYGYQEIADASIMQYTIEGLDLGQSYSVRLRARNEEGYGWVATATPASIRTVEAPGKPEDVSLIVMSNAMLKLVWSSPSSNGGSTVIQYRVDWDVDESFSNLATSGFYHVLSVSDDEGPHFYNIVVPAASSWMPRYARVRAYNSFAWSKPGLPVPPSALPALRPPGEPQGVTLLVTSGVDLLVSWSAPSTNLVVYGGDGGSAIEEYLVEWDTSAKFDSPSRRAVVAMPSALRYLIGGRDLMTGEESTELEPGVTYYTRVSAFNEQGYGAVVATVPAYATTDDQVPTSPEIRGAETAGATSIAGLLGVPSRDGGETLTKYRLEWDVSDDFSHINGSSRAGGWEDVPLVQEQQAFAVSSSVGQEEQWIIVTVEVTNEQQTVRTQVRYPLPRSVVRPL